MPFTPTTIPELPAASSVAGTDTVIVEQLGGTRKATVSQIVGQGVSGLVYADLNAAAADNLAALQALDVAAWHVAIVTPGTYRLSTWTINNLRALTIGPGVELLFVAGQSPGAAMIDVQRADFTLHLFGTLNGNRAEQANDNQKLFHSNNYDRVKVLGYGKSGLVTGCRGHAIWLRDGDDLLIQEVRGTDCAYDPLFITAETKSIHRPLIEGCEVDRSAEGGTANGTGCIKIQYTGGETITGTATAGSTTTITLEAGSSADDDFYNGMYIRATDGAGEGQSTWITDYVGSTRVATLADTQTTAFNNTTVYAIRPYSIYDGAIRKCNSKMSKTATNVPHEIWGGGVRCVIEDCYAEGGAIANSLDAVSDGGIINCRAFDFTAIGHELAGCTACEVNGGWADGNGNAGTDGVVTSNSNRDGYGNRVVGVHVRNCTGRQFYSLGGADSKAYGTVFEACVSRASAASVVGFYAEQAYNTQFVGCTHIGLGASQSGFVFYRSPGSIIASPTVVFSAAATRAILVSECDDIAISNPNLVGGGSSDHALQINDAQRVTVTGGQSKGFDTNHIELVANTGFTLDHIHINGFNTDGSAGSQVINNGGTVGDDITLDNIWGWVPYGIAGASLKKFAASFADCIWNGGYTTADPTTADGGNPIPGANGSWLMANGNIYTKKAGTWTVVN